ncbi:hypothetical protein TNCV_494861 [Trichonephila clavipes]|nr:hypothetical protein TNCV_494861 [Trichonephila clavipes]
MKTGCINDSVTFPRLIEPPRPRFSKECKFSISPRNLWSSQCSQQYCLWTRKRRDTSCMTGTGLRDTGLSDKRDTQRRINEENVILFPSIVDGSSFAVRVSHEHACKRHVELP